MNYCHEDFWNALDELVNSSEIVIDRPKGSAHPRFPDFIYRVDYGYLKNTASMDGAGIDVWVGSGEKKIDAIMCIVDLMKKDSEIKILIGCTEEEKMEVYQTHNETQYIDRMMQRFMSLSPDVKRSDVQVITFPRYSVRDYFAISINEDHRLKIKRAISNLVNGVWGSGKKPMCRLPISIENALSNETPNSPTKLHSPTKPVSNVGE